MIHVSYVDGDSDDFEIKDGLKPLEWLPEQQAYLIQSIEGEVIIPLAFIKRLKHYDVNLED